VNDTRARLSIGDHDGTHFFACDVCQAVDLGAKEVDRIEADVERLTHQLAEQDARGLQLAAEIESLQLALDGCQQLHGLRAEAERIKQAEVERLRVLGRAWAEAEDRWFEVSDARPYGAEAAAQAALTRRVAADALRAALAEEVTPIQTDP